MDKYLYISMTGASQNLNAMAVRSNNLANANTVGFKADLEQARAMPVYGEGLASRVFAMTERPGQDFSAGALVSTGRDLDMVVANDGWFVVQDADGNEAYSRNGSFDFTSDGQLIDSEGRSVVGSLGTVSLPVPLAKVQIGADGEISVRIKGTPANQMIPIDRLKIVEANRGDLEKGTDGLFRRKDGQDADPAFNVELKGGVVEASNVTPTEELVSMINLQRNFEMQIKMMKEAERNDEAQNRLLSMR